MTDLIDRLEKGDVLALSRLMTAVERGGIEAAQIVDRLFPKTGKAHRIGITGSTGAGKSTLVNALTRSIRARSETLGIIAEDPSSPLSGGAILGDRVRMAHAIGDDGVFVRSIASRGSESGFSPLAVDLADVLDAFGRDVIILETIGVGQLEHRIRHAADTTVVVFTPEAGDEVQSLKSGLMEVGDIYVVNKADRDGAERFARDITAILEIRNPSDGWRPPVVSTVATDEKGIDDLEKALSAHRAHMAEDGRAEARRRAGLRERIRALGSARAEAEFWGNPCIEAGFDGIFEKVAAHRLSPNAAALRLLEMYRKDAGGGTDS